jgi:predicted nucleotidyltransferase
MTRRLAILDDNQLALEERLAALRLVLPAAIAARACAAMVIGSVADGRARDASDIDLVVVLDTGLPRRADYAWWDEAVAPALPAFAGDRFPVHPVLIGRSALHTTEPNLRRALANGIPLWDPEGIFHDQPPPRA